MVEVERHGLLVDGDLGLVESALQQGRNEGVGIKELGWAVDKVGNWLVSIVIRLDVAENRSV